jgi:hypothetical protein
MDRGQVWNVVAATPECEFPDLTPALGVPPPHSAAATLTYPAVQKTGAISLKRDVDADRLSCSAYRANAFRLQLHAITYNLFVLFRRYVLRGTQLANATIDSIRLRLLKVGARVQRSVRRVWFHLASGWPGQLLFCAILDRLAILRTSP